MDDGEGMRNFPNKHGRKSVNVMTLSLWPWQVREKCESSVLLELDDSLAIVVVIVTTLHSQCWMCCDQFDP